jgi:hypothetical protein
MPHDLEALDSLHTDGEDTERHWASHDWNWNSSAVLAIDASFQLLHRGHLATEDPRRRRRRLRRYLQEGLDFAAFCKYVVRTFFVSQDTS